MLCAENPKPAGCIEWGMAEPQWASLHGYMLRGAPLEPMEVLWPFSNDRVSPAQSKPLLWCSTLAWLDPGKCSVGLNGSVSAKPAYRMSLDSSWPNDTPTPVLVMGSASNASMNSLDVPDAPVTGSRFEVRGRGEYGQQRSTTVHPCTSTA